MHSKLVFVVSVVHLSDIIYEFITVNNLCRMKYR